MAKVVIKLLGEPIQHEDDQAAEAITPGYLVGYDGSGDLVKHASAGAYSPCDIALEREEMGTGIDTDYAIGDTVKVGTFAPGMRFLGFIASGQNLAKGAIVESAGNGTFRVRASGVGLAQCLEATGAVTALTRTRFKAI